MKLLQILLLTLSLNIAALTIHKDVATMDEVSKIVKEASFDNFLTQNTLIVFDIDNTVLAMKKNLGSDQWFNWKADLLKNQNQNISNLLVWQQKLFSLGSMRLTETITPFFIDELQRDYRVIALTSRSPDNRVATERELRKYAINFGQSSIGEASRGSYGPLGHERKASYENGIFMTSGMHKGEMLIHLVESMYEGSFPFSQAVFIDDHIKNTKRVFDSLKEIGVEIASLRYSKEDKVVSKFKRSFEEKLYADMELMELEETLINVFGEAPPLSIIY